MFKAKLQELRFLDVNIFMAPLKDKIWLNLYFVYFSVLDLFPTKSGKKRNQSRDRPQQPFKKGKFDPKNRSKEGQKFKNTNFKGDKKGKDNSNKKEKKQETILEEIKRKKKKKEKVKAKGRPVGRGFKAKAIRKKTEQAKAKTAKGEKGGKKS